MSWPPLTPRHQLWSCSLNWVYRNWLEDHGFIWVRPVARSWAASLREPTIGRRLEFFTRWELGAVLVDSSEGRRLMRQYAVRS